MEAHSKLPQQKMEDSNRAIRRQRFGVRSAHGIISRFRSGTRTGTPPHFKLWMADLAIKSALQKTSVAALADRHDVPALASTYQVLFNNGFKSVWDLTQADARDLLRIRGIGPAKLEAVKADLAKQQVAVNW